METVLTPSNITFSLGIMAIIFSVYRYFKEPQVDGDKTAALLAQQVKSQNEAIAQRFNDVQESFKGLLLQSNNHIHTVQTQVENLGLAVVSMGKDIVKLSTIIEERIPKK
jgi:hypothetical protein